MYTCMLTELCNEVEMVTTDASPNVIPTGKASMFTANLICIGNLHLSLC